MVVVTVMCLECEDTRPARRNEDGTKPFVESCPNCGHDEYEVYAGG